MGKINVLSFAVANLIAAGEVVDRPASVVKELMENSIDAGAKRITVEIQNGGVTFLRVTDDGCGMEKDDLPVAIRRHATSKIKDASDLDTIITLGFRGEALAATCAVSKVRIISKPHDAPIGAMLEVNAGNIVSLSERGASDGTTVIVEDLFMNVPARRKFLKKDVTEAMAVTSVVEKVAVSHPEIAFSLIVDGRLKVETSGDGNLKSAIFAVFGRDFATRLIPVEGEFENVKVSGFIGRTDNVKANRAYENFFINQRYVRTKTAMAAVEQAYVSYLPQERFPACVLFLTIDPRRVDVNVHPAKLEVKFSNEKPVFEAIYYAVRTALEQNVTRPEVKLGTTSGPRMSDNPFPVNNGRGESVRNLQLRMTDAPASSSQTASAKPGSPAFDRVSAEEYRRKYLGGTVPGNHAVPAGKTMPASGNAVTATAVQTTGTVGHPFPGMSGMAGGGTAASPEDFRMGTTGAAGTSAPVAGTPGLSAAPRVPESLTAEQYLTGLDENRKAYGAEGSPEHPGVIPDAIAAMPETGRTVPGDGQTFAGNFATDDEEKGVYSVRPEEESVVAAQSHPEDLPENPPERKNYRILGEAFYSYVLVETGEKLLIIDKHAAHERLIFERLKTNMRSMEVPSQMLMLPVEVMLMTDEVGLVEAYRQELESVGFAFTTARNTVSVSAIPDGIEQSAIPDMLTAIVGRIKSATGSAKLTRDILFEKALYQASCKAAIKAGREYPEEHIEWLVDEMMKLPDITFCPHGRPVALELTKKNLDHQFERT